MNKKYDAKINIRPLIMLIYFIAIIPGQFRGFFFKAPPPPDLRFYYQLSVLAVFIGLELVEYLFFRYEKAGRLYLGSAFAARAVMILLPAAVTFINTGRFNVFYYLYLPLLCFYAYLALPLAAGIIFTAGVTVFYLFMDISHFSKAGIDIQLLLLFLIQKVITIVVFYLFAHLWSTDLKKSRENDRLMKELNESQSRLRIYAREIARTAALEERTRLARDIHDSVGHSLTAIQIQSRKAAAYLERDPSEACRALAAIEESAALSMKDIRESLAAFREPDSGPDLSGRFEAVIKSLNECGIKAGISVTGTNAGCNYASLLALYRFVQEGSTNIMKHSGASEAGISIDFGPERISAVISDNGTGFNAGELSGPDEDSYGLCGLRERLELVRGSLDILSGPGGTVLKAVIPKDPVKLLGGGCE